MASLSMKYVVVALLGLYSSAAYELGIGKTMDNGVSICAGITNCTVPVIDLQLEKDGSVHIQFDISIPDNYVEHLDTKIFFANAKKEISQFTLTDSAITLQRWSKPWILVPGTETIKDDNISAANTDYTIRADLLPPNTTRVSGSITAKDNDGKTVLFNHYGIENYEISIDGGDPFIVESYMPVNFIVDTIKTR